MFGLSTWKIVAVVAVLGGIGGAVWFHFDNVGDLREDYAAAQSDLAQAEQARQRLDREMDAYQDRVEQKMAQQRQALQQLQADYTAVREKTDQLDQTLAEHDLTQLSVEKPGLIETRVNEGTEQIFQRLEQISTREAP